MPERRNVYPVLALLVAGITPTSFALAETDAGRETATVTQCSQAGVEFSDGEDGALVLIPLQIGLPDAPGLVRGGELAVVFAGSVTAGGAPRNLEFRTARTDWSAGFIVRQPECEIVGECRGESYELVFDLPVGYDASEFSEVRLRGEGGAPPATDVCVSLVVEVGARERPATPAATTPVKESSEGCSASGQPTVPSVLLGLFGVLQSVRRSARTRDPVAMGASA